MTRLALLLALVGAAPATPPDCPPATGEEETTMAIVAIRDLYQGVTITEDDLYAIEIPPRLLAEGVYLSPEYVVGRIPSQRILANEYIREEALFDAEATRGTQELIPRGQRAVSLAVDPGLAATIHTGNYVDLFGSLPWDGGQVGCVVAEGAYVLEARTGHRDDGGTLIFSLTPFQALLFAHVQIEGQVSVALRNDLDLEATWPVPMCRPPLPPSADPPEAPVEAP